MEAESEILPKLGKTELVEKSCNQRTSQKSLSQNNTVVQVSSEFRLLESLLANRQLQVRESLLQTAKPDGTKTDAVLRGSTGNAVLHNEQARFMSGVNSEACSTTKCTPAASIRGHLLGGALDRLDHLCSHGGLNFYDGDVERHAEEAGSCNELCSPPPQCPSAPGGNGLQDSGSDAAKLSADELSRFRLELMTDYGNKVERSTATVTGLAMGLASTHPAGLASGLLTSLPVLPTASSATSMCLSPPSKFNDPVVAFSTMATKAALLNPILSNVVNFLQRRKKRQCHRRQRTTFSTDQTIQLEIQFQKAEYVTKQRRIQLAQQLQLSEAQIKIWYQNRRAKDKRIEKAHFDQQLRAIGYEPVLFNYPALLTTSSAPPVAVSLPVPGALPVTSSIALSAVSPAPGPVLASVPASGVSPLLAAPTSGATLLLPPATSVAINDSMPIESE